MFIIYECNDVDVVIKLIFFCMNWLIFSKKVEDIYICDFILYLYDFVFVIMLMIYFVILINVSIYSCMINKDGLRMLKISIV